MKKIMLVILALSAMAVNANNLAMTAEELKKLSPEQREQRKKKAEQIIRQRTGGFVIKEGTGKGLIVLVDAQKTVGQEALKRPLSFIRKPYLLQFKVTYLYLDLIFNIHTQVIQCI